MSYEAWGDGDKGMDGWVREEIAEECFVKGARVMREMLARFVEQGGDATIAMSIRANWNPNWGNDPGRWEGDLPSDCWSDPASVEKAMDHFQKALEVCNSMENAAWSSGPTNFALRKLQGFE